jgi:translation elongation factor P/translation initiation factor 5A
VLDVQVSPASNIFATLYVRGKSRAVSVFNYSDGSAKHTFKLPDNPTAISFSSNAKYLCVADAGRVIRVFNSSDYQQIRTIPTAFAPKKISLSNNGYYIAAFEDNIVYIWNFETGRVRKIIEMANNVNHIAFSPDNAQMAILTEVGKLHIYDTRTFEQTEVHEGMSDAKECAFHPEGKYIAIITATDKIVILNMKNSSEERQVVHASNGGINHLGYARTVTGTMNLVYNNGLQFVFHPLEKLVPDYERLVRSEVEEKMDEWLKQMPGESLEEYHLRVNEETRAQQYALFENEIATEMAGDMIGQAEISFGNYNQEQQMLEINFDNMQEIYLEVPQEDVAEFSRPEKLAFENSVYGVTEDDKFELLYTEVTNTETGKKYVFDNLDKQSLAYLASDENFVPLDLIQQSSMEEIKLQEIREEVVAAAKEASLISEHTHIDVKTKVEAATNADGDKIMNYSIEFNYDVEQEFSSQEDFGPGKYIISQSESAMAMLKIVGNAFQNEFKEYLAPGKKVIIYVTGSADAAPIKNKIAYNEEYGAFNEELVYSKGELTTITLNRSTGITNNEQLALLRAMGVKDYVQKNVPQLNNMQCEYNTYLNVSNERGAEFRRIGIKFVFVDAF